VLAGAEYFGAFVEFFNLDSIEVGEAILNFLSEVIQGDCERNVKIVCESKVLEYIKDFL
jgi:hypothetical protein